MQSSPENQNEEVNRFCEHSEDLSFRTVPPHYLEVEDDLCCCEYINIKGERCHLLGFCCDCDTLDDSFERFVWKLKEGTNEWVILIWRRLIQRQQIPESYYNQLYAVIRDRLRIPWYGGARRIDLSTLPPFALLPILGCWAAMGPISTITSFVMVPILFRLLSKYNTNGRTRVYFSFSLATLFYSFLVCSRLEEITLKWLFIFNYFNFQVVFFARKNEWFTHTFHLTMLSSIIVSLSITKWKGRKDASLCVENLPFYYYCRRCQFYISGRDHHCSWLDCCIGKRNRLWFIQTLFLTIAWILGVVYFFYESIQRDLSIAAIYADFA